MERFTIALESDIGIAVVGVQAQARRLGFTQDQIDRLGTAVSELARNIVKYAGCRGGDIVCQEEPRGQTLRLVVQARDNGPGIDDISRALSDHYSSSGSLGLGLPGVKRIMDECEVVSIVGSGTVVTIALQR